MESLISSTQNPKIKFLLTLQNKSAERRKNQLFVVEGQRELEHCIEAGYELESVFKLPDVHLPCPTNAPCFTVTSSVYERIAYRGSTEGIMAIVKAKGYSLKSLTDKLTRQSKAPLIVVLERVEKPGNLGAVLRSADAAAADVVIICDPLTDLYNPNLIRASIGAVFSVPTVVCSSEDCIRWLKAQSIRILTAQLQDSKYYYETDMCGPTAIVMGTEATGLTDAWRQVADAHIRIPMLGALDSLNVSVSAAILLFEAVRQRFQNL